MNLIEEFKIIPGKTFGTSFAFVCTITSLYPVCIYLLKKV